MLYEVITNRENGVIFSRFGNRHAHLQNANDEPRTDIDHGNDDSGDGISYNFV